MSKYIIQHLRKGISVCLAVMLLLSLVVLPVSTVHAAESDTEKVSMILNSDEVDASSIDLYVYDSEYYITIDDLCALTRCVQSKEGSIVSVQQGFWSGSFNVETQTFDDTVQRVDVPIPEITAGVYAVPAIAFLSYFRATAWIEEGTLYCRMPACTAWEALDIDFTNTLVDIYELYGGEDGVEFAIRMDILYDLMVGNAIDETIYMDNALNCALNVNMFENEALQQYIKEINGRLYQDMNSDNGLEFMKKLDENWSSVDDATRWYIHHYYDAMAKNYAMQAYDARQIGDKDAFSAYSEEIFEVFRDKNYTKEVADDFFNDADCLAVFFSAAVDTAQEIKYTEASNNIVYQVLGTDNLRKYGLDADWSYWGARADCYQDWNTLAADNVEQAALEYYVGSYETLVSIFMDGMTQIANKPAIGQPYTYGGAFLFGLELGRTIAKMYPSNQAFSADMNALVLSEVQTVTVKVIVEILKQILETPDQVQLYSEYIRALQMYCRVSIALYENLIIPIETFKWGGDEVIDLFSKKADLLYIYLYRLTQIQDGGAACLPMDLNDLYDQMTNAESDAYSTTAGYAGQWEIDTHYTMEKNGVSMWDLFGSSFSDYGSSMYIEEDGSFSYGIAAGIGGSGSWCVQDGDLNYNITTYEEQMEESGTLRLVETEYGAIRLVMECGPYSIFWGNTNPVESDGQPIVPDSAESLAGIWYCADTKKAYLFATTGCDTAVTATGLRAVDGTYIEFDLLNDSAKNGGFDLVDEYIAIYTPKAKLGLIRLRGDTLVIAGDTYKKAPTNVESGLIGTWVDGTDVITFTEDHYKRTGMFSGSGPYYVLSEDIFVIFMSGDYIDIRYEIDGNQLHYNTLKFIRQ